MGGMASRSGRMMEAVRNSKASTKAAGVGGTVTAASAAATGGAAAGGAAQTGDPLANPTMVFAILTVISVLVIMFLED